MQRPLKVLHLCAVDFTVRQFIAPLALRLAAEGHDVQCACTRGPHWEELAAMGVRMVDVPVARSASPLEAMRSLWRVYRALRRLRPDVLHVHTPVASFIGRLAGRLAGVPVIVYTAHGFYFHDRMPRTARWIHVLLERSFRPLTDWLLCVSREDARDAVRLGIQRGARVVHVSNGANPERFDPEKLKREGARQRIRSELNIPGDAVVVCMTGRLVREKGFLELLEAFRMARRRTENLYLVAAGDTVVSEHDSAREEILRRAADREIAPYVRMTGLRGDVPELLAASDIFCLPSWREGMPVSILEAMMMRLPVIASRIRGCREEVSDVYTGYLVEPRGTGDLTEAIVDLCGHPGRRLAMGQRGRRRAVRLFDERRLLERQVRVYNRIAEGLGR